MVLPAIFHQNCQAVLAFVSINGLNFLIILVISFLTLVLLVANLEKMKLFEKCLKVTGTLARWYSSGRAQ